MTVADRRAPRSLAAPSVGVGFKPEHFEAILDTRPELGFFEVHAENYMGAGGAPHRRLDAIRELYPLSLHGVGLSIGSPGPLDRAHLQRLAAVAKRFEPTLVSEHLAWSTHEGAFLNDLLPLPYTDETVARVSEHIDEVQNALGRTMMLENPSTYVVFAESTWAETDFLREIARRTGCGLLLDVNNVFVSAVNHGFDPGPLSRRFSAVRGGRNPSRRLCRGQRRRGSAAPDRRPQFAGSRFRLGALWRGDPKARPDADADRMGQRRSRLAHAFRRSAPGGAYDCRDSSNPGSAPMSFEAAIGAFAKALGDPSAAAPPMTRGRMGAPDARRFAVYRNNVAVGLIGALEARYPVSRRIVGEGLFGAMARAFVRVHKPRSPVMIAYGEAFPEFADAYLSSADVPPRVAMAADVARLENAWVEAYHAEDAGVATVADLSALGIEALPQTRIAFHPAARFLRLLTPAASAWAAYQDGADPTAPITFIPEDALITRPDCDVRVRVLPALAYDFARSLRDGATLMDAALALNDPTFDLGTHLVGLVEAGAVAAILPGRAS